MLPPLQTTVTLRPANLALVGEHRGQGGSARRLDQVARLFDHDSVAWARSASEHQHEVVEQIPQNLLR